MTFNSFVFTLEFRFKVCLSQSIKERTCEKIRSIPLHRYIQKKLETFIEEEPFSITMVLKNDYLYPVGRPRVGFEL
jgi:hypothetical protein